MEKYKRFTDGPTGINPFTGPATEAPTTARLVIAWVIAVPLLALPLLLVLALYVVLTVLTTLLPLSFIALPLRWLCMKLCVAPLLWMFSWSTLSRTTYPAQKSSLSARGDDGVQTPSPGDVILVNCQSPLDVLAVQLAYPRYPLTYCFPSVAHALGTETGPTNDVDAIRREPGVFRAMTFMLSWAAPSPMIEKPTNLPPTRCFDMTINQLSAEKAGRVLVLFAEGASSNGRGILSIPPLMFSKAHKMHIAALSYSNPRHALVLPHGGSLPSWLVKCLSQSLFRSASIDVASVRSTSNPSFPAAFSAEWSSALQSRLALAASFNRSVDSPCRALATTATDKRFFLAYWNLYNSPDAVPAAAPAPVASSTRGTTTSRPDVALKTTKQR